MAYHSANIPRGLSDEEAAAWAKLAQSVTPFAGRTAPPMPQEGAANTPSKLSKPAREKPRNLRRHSQEATSKAVVRLNHEEPHLGLDGSWEKTLRSGNVAPDVTLDLHGHNLDSAYHRRMPPASPPSAKRTAATGARGRSIWCFGAGEWAGVEPLTQTATHSSAARARSC